MKPIASMTGFAVAVCDVDGGSVCVELKSVNSRFLDLGLRVADELRATEPAIREAIASNLNRGKIECRASWLKRSSGQPVQLNLTALNDLAEIDQALRAAMPWLAPLSSGEVLAWKGVVEVQDVGIEALHKATLDALAVALEALQSSRVREGAALRTALMERCNAIDLIVAELTKRAPLILATVEKKLAERLNQALAGPLSAGGAMTREEIGERIRQEVTLYGLRVDVDEELSRLSTHVTEVRRVLAAGGPVGRRLDFLMQELNREANTLASKASAVDLTHAAVELKLTVEQMREQVQNLE